MAQQTESKNCERCAKRCRVAPVSNPNAQVFRRGDMKTGRFCAECLIVDFFKNFDLGPSSALGKSYFDSFNPECLRLPHIQAQLARIIVTAQTQYGSELDVSEIDWEEVIANWHLPFPGKKKRS